MAVVAVASAKLAEAAGPEFPVVSVTLAARHLREAGQDDEGEDFIPTSGRGGGKRSQHLTARHLANLVMALAAAPIFAVPSVKTLRPLRYAARTVVYRSRGQPSGGHTELTGTVHDHRDPENLTLGECLEREITDRSDPHRRAAWAVHHRGRELILCLSPASAQISWPTSTGIWTDLFQAPDQPLPFTYKTFDATEPPLPGRRLTVLPFAVLGAAGELLEDSLARTRTSARNNNGAEMTPARVASTPSPTLSSDQDRVLDPGPLPSPDRTARAQNAQAESSRELGHSQPPPGSCDRDRRDRRNESSTAPP